MDKENQIGEIPNKPLLTIEEVLPVFGGIAKTTFFQWRHRKAIPDELFLKIARSVFVRRCKLIEYINGTL